MMKVFRYILLLAFVQMFSLYGFALEINENWKMQITNDLEIIHNDAWGPGQANSFLYQGNSGWSYENRFDFLNRLTLDEVIYEFDTEVRFTNNERIDTEDVSLKKLYFKRASPYTLFQMGDFFANFSQYSLNQNLKGAIFSLNETEDTPWDFSLIAGAYKPRWEYVLSDKADELKDTFFHGMRLGRKIGSWLAHFNYVFTDESRLVDISTNTSRSTAEIVHNHLWSIDWKFRPAGGLDFSGESAISKNHSTTNTNKDFGYAHRARGRFRIKNLRSQFEYERTPSDFNTPGGSASSDRERYRIRNNYYLGEQELFANYTAYWDNVQNTSSTTTKVKMPEVGMTLRNLLKRNTLSSTLRLRQRRRHRTDQSLDERTDSLSFSIEDRFGPFRPSFEYEYRRVNPRKDPNDSGEKTHAFNLRLNSYHRKDAWTFRPTVSLRQETTKDLGLGTGRGTNKDWIWSGGLNAGFKNDLRLNAAYTLSQAENYTADSDSRRRVLRLSLDYNIAGSRDNVIGIEYQDRRNSFSETLNDYNENICKFRWTRRF